jgi:hypothetical protein
MRNESSVIPKTSNKGEPKKNRTKLVNSAATIARLAVFFRCAGVSVLVNDKNIDTTKKGANKKANLIQVEIISAIFTPIKRFK